MDYNKPLNIVLVGDPGVGKTTLISKCHEFNPTADKGGFFTRDFKIPSSYKPTSLCCHLTSIYQNKGDRSMMYSVFRANIIDTGGGRRYDYVRPLAYMDADVFLVCFDISNRQSFQNVWSRWLPEVKKYEPKVPILLVGTKSDLKSRRQVTEGDALAQLVISENRERYVETKSYGKNGMVCALFDKAVELAFTYRKDFKSRSRKTKDENVEPSSDITTLEKASDPPECPRCWSKLSSDWQMTFDNKRAADVTLRFSDQSSEIHAHKFVLALASTAFRKLFKTIDNMCGTVDRDETECCKCCTNSENSNDQDFDSNFLEKTPFSQVHCPHCNSKKVVDRNEGKNELFRTEALPIHITFKSCIKHPVFLCVLKWMYTGHLDISDKPKQNFIEDLQKILLELDIQALKFRLLRILQHQQDPVQHCSIPIPPPLPPLLPSARGNNLGQHGSIPIPPPLPPLLPSSRGQNPGQHGSIPIPPPLPPLLPSARGNNLGSDANIPIPPPLPPLLPSARGNNLEQHSNIPVPPPLPRPTISKSDLASVYQEMWEYAHSLLLDDDLHPELVVIVDDTPIRVHRVVLISRSSVLAAMLDGNFKERDLNTVRLPGVPLEHFRSVLEFMYSDTCPIDETNVKNIMELADMFDVPSLMARCEEYIVNTLSDNTITGDSLERRRDLVMDAIYLSETFNARLLHKWCLHFVATNYDLFEREEDFKAIWSRNEEYMESNRWPTRHFIQALKQYKASKGKLNDKSIRKRRSNTTKCACCIM